MSQCWHEPDDVRVAVRMAREVMAEARDDPTSLRFAAQVLAYSAKDYETALSAIERSLYLNPNSAQGYTGSGWVNAHSGRPLVAIEHFHSAMRLSPIDPEKGIALSGIGMSYLMLERFEEALRWGEDRAARDAQLRLLLPGRDRCAGRAGPAGRGARRGPPADGGLPDLHARLQTQINPWRDQAFAERYLEGLRLAGVPVGPRTATRENPSGLTAREIDILALVSDNLSNKEIASRLCISPEDRRSPCGCTAGETPGFRRGRRRPGTRSPPKYWGNPGKLARKHRALN